MAMLSQATRALLNATRGKLSNLFRRNKALVIGAYDRMTAHEDCTELSPIGEKLDNEVNGKLRSALNGLPAGIGKLGRVTVVTNVSPEFGHIAVAGLGDKDADFNKVEYLDEGKENVRIATGLGARTLQKLGENEIAIEGFDKAEAAAEGAYLGVWYYTDKEIETKVSLYENGDPEEWERGVTKAEAQNIVRCLSETPSNFLTPRIFAILARDLLCPLGVQVTARDTKWMTIHNLNNLLTLGASTVEPPIFLELSYCGDPDAPTNPYTFIGQGTTFNSGGLCRRHCKDMDRADMAAAATVLSIFKAAASMRMSINVRGFIPLYENMLSGTSVKSGDMFKIGHAMVRSQVSQNSSQIVLAETMSYAINNYPPELLFTLGTLSPNIQHIAGATTAVWARNDYIWDHINYAGALTGDRMWRFPLFDDYLQKLTMRSDVDISNLGIGSKGEPNLIAQFLNRFAPPELDFTYIDITGSSDIANGYVHYLEKDLMTGAPTRALIQLLCHLNHCKEKVREAAKKEIRSGSEN